MHNDDTPTTRRKILAWTLPGAAAVALAGRKYQLDIRERNLPDIDRMTEEQRRAFAARRWAGIATLAVSHRLKADLFPRQAIFYMQDFKSDIELLNGHLDKVSNKAALLRQCMKDLAMVEKDCLKNPKMAKKLGGCDKLPEADLIRGAFQYVKEELNRDMTTEEFIKAHEGMRGVGI